MNVTRLTLIGLLIAALPVLAGADVIPISDVNENDESGLPVLRGETVTVKGVVTVATGELGTTNDIYVQDATGGVNVLQPDMASPVVALGDSVMVTGVVDHATSSGRTALYIDSSLPGTRMVYLSGGHVLPEPLELTARDIAVSGNSYEGIWAVVRGASLASGYSWGACGSPAADSYTKVDDGDTTCWLWYDKDAGLCGSTPPMETFDVYGVIVPDLRPAPRPGHGILPVRPSDVLSVGPGSGLVTVAPERVYTEQDVDLEFSFEAEGGTLTQVSIGIPDGWTFSGQTADVALDGPAFSGADVVSTPDYAIVTGCTLTAGSSGRVTLRGLTAPDAAGSYSFIVMTADEGGDLTGVREPPEVGVGAQAAAGTVLINELYAHSGGSDLIDRSEFIELYNPGSESVDLTGWVLTDIDDSGRCGGSNLWEFPPGTTLDAGGYLVVAKDARFSYGQGFYYVFGEYPDFELYDPYGQDLDWPDADAPNMILVSPPDGDDSVNQEIRLMGGPDGSGTLEANMPAYEAVLLYTDRTLAFLVDAVEYRDPVLLDSDPCVGSPGLGGADDSWVPGPPPWDTSLCRDEVSTDTDVSRDDFFLAPPTPGEVNPASDEFPPTVNTAMGAGRNMALVEFSEPFDPEEAGDPSNYDLGDAVTVEHVSLSRDGRTALLITTDLTPDEEYTLEVEGVTDAAGNAMEPFSGSIQIGANTVGIGDVQAYDEEGFSLLSGQTVRVVGFATVPPGVFQPEHTNMYIQDLDDWGVNVFAYSPMNEPALEGDLLAVTGEVLDYISSSSGAGATTEVSASSITVLARGFEPLEPAVLLTGEVGHEENEGRFVRTSGVVVSVEGFAVYINDGSGAVQIYQNFNDLDFGVFAVGDSVEVTGVVLQYDQLPPFLAGYELSPRYDYDIVIRSAHYSGSATVRAAARVLDIGAEEAVEIRFNAPRASQVTVRIYDLKGREVATVFDGMCLGPQRTTWDGRDDAGRKVPVGAYLCHIIAVDRVTGKGTDAAVPVVVGTRLD